MSQSLTPPITFQTGQATVATAGTRVQLSASSILVDRGVVVKALDGNSGKIYVGNSGVTASNGFELGAGQGITVDTDNLNDIWIDSSVNGDDACWMLS